MQRTWFLALTTGVGVVDVPAMGVAVIPVVEPLDGHERLHRAFRHRWLLIRRGWIASAGTARSVTTRQTMTAALLLLQCVGGGGGLLLLQRHAELLHGPELALH